MTGRIVVLAAPSGGGKTTIAAELLRRAPERYGYSVSATTRAPRAGEQEGVAYHFLTRDGFERRVAGGEFLEWAAYAGERYGTLQAEVERTLASGRHVVLDIEVQGAQQVRTRYPAPASVSFFILPPAPVVLIERLRRRRTESEAQLAERLAIAVQEVRAAQDDALAARVFDTVVVNDDLEAAVDRVQMIVEGAVPIGPEPRETLRLLTAFARELDIEAERFTHHARRST